MRCRLTRLGVLGGGGGGGGMVSRKKSLVNRKGGGGGRGNRSDWSRRKESERDREGERETAKKERDLFVCLVS